VRLVCAQMLRDANDVDDAVQQTFLSAYKSLLSGVEPLDGEAWIVTIARNECLARIRGRMRTPLADGELDDLPGTDDPAERAAQYERVALVLGALRRLPLRERTAVAMQAFAGASNAELARGLGTTESAVESILVRARAQLRPVLAASRALALAPLGLRNLLLRLVTTPGIDSGTEIAGAAKLGAALAVVGSVVALGPAQPAHRGLLAPAVKNVAAATPSVDAAGGVVAPSAPFGIAPGVDPAAGPGDGRRGGGAPRTPGSTRTGSAALPAVSGSDDADGAVTRSEDGGSADSRGPSGSSGDGGSGSSDDGGTSGSGSSGPDSSGSGSGSSGSGSDDGANDTSGSSGSGGDGTSDSGSSGESESSGSSGESGSGDASGSSDDGATPAPGDSGESTESGGSSGSSGSSGSGSGSDSEESSGSDGTTDGGSDGGTETTTTTPAGDDL